MRKFQILQSMHFTGRARCRNWFFQLSLNGSSVTCISSILACKTRQEVQAPSKADLDLSSATSTLMLGGYPKNSDESLNTRERERERVLSTFKHTVRMRGDCNSLC
jgi:hypothetical protein